MYEKFKELILSLDEKGLKELYQMFNMRYFELYINGNDEYSKRYKEKNWEKEEYGVINFKESGNTLFLFSYIKVW